MEGVALDAVARAHGTPCYVYSSTMIEQAWQAYADAFSHRKHLICYAVKANTNRAVLQLLARRGSGFDIVSGGELERVLQVGADARKIVFAGVGKSKAEIAAALKAGVRHFNVESLPELERIGRIAEELAVVAPVGLRVNPEVDPQTHPYIATGLKESKFGLSMADVEAARELIQSTASLELESLGCHIGSQLTDIAPFGEAVSRIVELADAWVATGTQLDSIDVGGGLGIAYQGESIASVREYADIVLAAIGERDYDIVLEPGRSITGPAGVLLTRVEHVKHGERRNFAIVDAAMNDLIRPALYDASHRIQPVQFDERGERLRCDIVGPVCESGDFLGLAQEISLAEDSLLAVRDAGAYGFVMSSNYNSRARAAEVMVRGSEFALVRERENVISLSAGESPLPEKW